MIKELSLTLSPKEAALDNEVRRICARRLSVSCEDITAVRFIRKSIDSRRREIKINALVRVFIGQEEDCCYDKTVFPDVSSRPQAVVVGAGPAGLYAALTLIENGWRPVVLERGADVHQRKKDCALLCREGRLDPDSNYCFGEGGAGCFSDGKLYTRSVKRGNVRRILSILVQHGASPDILSDAHPHIGSDRLPSVIERMRMTITGAGGEVHFGTRVTALERRGDEVTGAICADGTLYSGPVILATGHSAHDVYSFLAAQGFTLEAKDVAVGVRLEHPQTLIDQMQYHSSEGRGKWLPPASYSFTAQVEGRGVYSFCMCPGGIIVPASTGEDALVVNGMSPASRSGRWANSGIVVQLRVSDLKESDSMAMLRFTKAIERACFNPLFKAPAQRMTDFMSRRQSSSLPSSSYIPGLVSMSMDEVLPPVIASSLRKGLEAFSAMSRGRFLSNEALLIAPETRTSSPVRIVRGADYSQISGFYPCGEGAGYAGGIVSAALDGTAAALAAARMLDMKGKK